MPSLAETYDQILHEEEPNFLRLYLNPHVARTCFCLDRYVRTTWADAETAPGRPGDPRNEGQSFLANGLEEALGGAIKLTRYARYVRGRRSQTLVFDPADRLAGFAGVRLAGGDTVSFLPGVRVLGKGELCGMGGIRDVESGLENGLAESQATGINSLVLVAGTDPVLDQHAELIRTLVDRHAPLVITCVDRAGLAAIRSGSTGILRELVPDITIFDESFVNRVVPFAAFTARKWLFDCWNHSAKATFHSTTFQPNTISTRHFMRCLAEFDPAFFHEHHELLERLGTDLSLRGEVYRRLFNPSLSRLIRATRFVTSDVRAAGSSIFVDGRPLFDAVSGVACSFRGHNPPSYGREMNALEPPARAHEGSPGAGVSLIAELGNRLRSLTGLEFLLPAVSGATAVENALKIALVAQFPRRHVLALKAGFGGKTLLSLTATANQSYKERIDPLYADVHYVDPFAPDALAQIDGLMEAHEFAVVQIELIQSVGGVRPVPDDVIQHLAASRQRWGYLLLVDEVQTGMYRTGPFIRSQAVGVVPDLLLLGKATSDMMFPFALTLYSAAVRARVERNGSDLIALIQQQYGYDHGFKTVLNVLRQAETENTSRRVACAGELIAKLLSEGLASCPVVADVRVFGLLIGIELDVRKRPQRWLRKRLSTFYLLAMLRHNRFPVLAGFCQYEPNVLKITPSCHASHDEIRQCCATIVDVLKRPLRRVIAAGLVGLIRPPSRARKYHEHTHHSTLEPVAR
jgi:acetylornithine/succinyldiaminopimelate/putrescine aminotransferase